MVRSEFEKFAGGGFREGLVAGPIPEKLGYIDAIDEYVLALRFESGQAVEGGAAESVGRPLSQGLSSLSGDCLRGARVPPQ